MRRGGSCYVCHCLPAGSAAAAHAGGAQPWRLCGERGHAAAPACLLSCAVMQGGCTGQSLQGSRCRRPGSREERPGSGGSGGDTKASPAAARCRFSSDSLWCRCAGIWPGSLGGCLHELLRALGDAGQGVRGEPPACPQPVLAAASCFVAGQLARLHTHPPTARSPAPFEARHRPQRSSKGARPRWATTEVPGAAPGPPSAHQPRSSLTLGRCAPAAR